MGNADLRPQARLDLCVSPDPSAAGMEVEVEGTAGRQGPQMGDGYGGDSSVQ